MDNSDQARFTELTADIVAAYLSNNNVRPEEVGSLIGEVHTALVRAPGASAEPEPEVREPAVPIRKSITPDCIVCLEDGKKFKSLKRHLNGEHGLTPDEYRAKWGLPRDYPMVAPNYAQARSDLAKTMGLGRKAAPVEEAQETAAPKRARRAKAG